ncbi:MAG: nucleotidyltransferase family protein [Lachnospiraceae bacterium]|nr:nucleotidyltransferase family protein [Lachnospiraceae bacterium]
MYYYKVFGYTFRCAYEIKQLYKVPATAAFDVDIILDEMPQEVTECVHNTDIFPCIAWNEERFWMNNAYGILAVYKSGTIYAKSISDKDTFYLLQYVLGYGIAMYAHLHNRLTIHCSSVCIDGKCIIIAGDSGAGKSTLTNELILDGSLMLSDDVIAIGYDENHVPCIYPAFPQQKLCRDAATKQGYNLDELLYVDPEKDKFAVLHNEHFSPEPQKLHAAYYLKTNEKDLLRFSSLEGFAKVSFIVDNLYLGCLLPNTGLSAEAFQLCVDFIKDCPVHCINRPDERNTLAQIKKYIYLTLGCDTVLNTKHYMTLLKCIAETTMPPKEVVSAITVEDLYLFATLNKLDTLLLPILEAWKIYTPEDILLVRDWRGDATARVILEYKKQGLINKLLQKAATQGLTPILFKGYVLADLYKDFTFRSSSDTDILISPRELQAFTALLKELQYSHASDLDTEDVYTYIYEKDGGMIHKIELHTSLFEDAAGHELEVLKALQLSAKETLLPLHCCNMNLCTLGHTQHLIYQIFHMVKHICYYGLPARYLPDTALFIRKYHDEIDWEVFHKAMTELGYACFCRQLFTGLVHYFGLPREIMRDWELCPLQDIEALLQDILTFGAGSFEETLGDNFYFFETYIQKLEHKTGTPLETITFDGTTVPEKRVPLKYQSNKKLQNRIRLLRQLQLI